MQAIVATARPAAPCRAAAAPRPASRGLQAAARPSVRTRSLASDVGKYLSEAASNIFTPQADGEPGWQGGTRCRQRRLLPPPPPPARRAHAPSPPFSSPLSPLPAAVPWEKMSTGFTGKIVHHEETARLKALQVPRGGAPAGRPRAVLAWTGATGGQDPPGPCPAPPTATRCPLATPGFFPPCRWQWTARSRRLRARWTRRRRAARSPSALPAAALLSLLGSRWAFSSVGSAACCPHWARAAQRPCARPPPTPAAHPLLELAGSRRQATLS